MFKNHNDLNIDEIDIVQIEENRKKVKSGNQIMIKKIEKTAMYHSHFSVCKFSHIFQYDIYYLSYQIFNTKNSHISTMVNIWFI